MTEVRVACSDFLKQQLDPSNCLGIRRFADVHSCMDLLAAAHGYTEQHFSEIVHGEEFLNLPAMQICELISSDQLTVPSEEKVNIKVLVTQYWICLACKCIFIMVIE